MFVILVIGGILMILLGFIGVYIGFIFQEVKGRPIYLVQAAPKSQAEPPLEPVHAPPAQVS
jgi:dolichol-phosphate mannosyltransferase